MIEIHRRVVRMQVHVYCRGAQSQFMSDGKQQRGYHYIIIVFVLDDLFEIFDCQLHRFQNNFNWSTWNSERVFLSYS